jgi:hypothetical protein
MHGIILAELKAFVERGFGERLWTNVIKRAQLPDEMFVPSGTYPDELVMKIVSVAAGVLGKPVPTVLEEFGEFVVPDLIRLYQALIDPRWKTIDLIANTERTIHTVLRARGASPPELKTVRGGPDEAHVSYNSPRRLCALAKGITKGVAKHYGEKVRIDESSCMLRGHPSCEITVRIASGES